MKVSVCATVTYQYEVEIPEELNDVDKITITAYCDGEDPVFSDLCKVLSKNHLNFDGEIISVVDENSDEVIWER